MKPLKQGSLPVMLMPLCLLATACQMTGSGGTRIEAAANGHLCQSFDFIRWSRTDTRYTQEQVTEHNAVLRKLCPGKKP
jgi:hypothetical protein